MLLLALALVAAQPNPSPVTPGLYARPDRPCATHGDAAAYANLLHVDAGGISDTGHARRIAHAREENGAIVLDQWSDDLVNGGGSRTLSWVVRIMGPSTFVLIGADRGVEWTGQWRWCGAAIP